MGSLSGNSIEMSGDVNAELSCMFLSPLPGENRSYVKSQLKVELWIGDDLPFRNFLLAYFLKKASWVTGRAR